MDDESTLTSLAGSSLVAEQALPTNHSMPVIGALTDEQLKALASDCATELKQRTAARKREALEQIRALARAHDLDIEVKAGRRSSRKGSSAAAQEEE